MAKSKLFYNKKEHFFSTCHFPGSTTNEILNHSAPSRFHVKFLYNIKERHSQPVQIL